MNKFLYGTVLVLLPLLQTPSYGREAMAELVAGQSPVAMLLRDKGETKETPSTFLFSDLNGYRLRDPRTNTVYLIIDGTRRTVPDAMTYENLFVDWNGIYDEPLVGIIPSGPALTSGSFLIKTTSGTLYLFSNGLKYRVKDPSALDRYYFDPSKAASWTDAIAATLPSGIVLE